MKCAICGAERGGNVCHNCGYDASCDFTEHRTVSPVPKGDAAQRQFMYTYRKAERLGNPKIVSEPAKPQTKDTPDIPQTPPVAVAEEKPENKTQSTKSIKSLISKKLQIAILAAAVLIVVILIIAIGPNEVDSCGGAAHVVTLYSDGTVVAEGDNQYGQCDVDDWTDIVAIAAYGRSTVGLCSDGTTVVTGLDSDADRAIQLLYDNYDD